MTEVSDIIQSKGARMAAGRLGLRQQLWPDVTESQLWNRKREVGFTTVPRFLPMVMVIADSLTKGTPVSTTYLDLWCRAFDEGFVRLDKPHEMALASGFSTARGPQIWTGRLDLLAKHGFIRFAPGAQGVRSFALLMHPLLVVLGKRAEIEPRLLMALQAQAFALGTNMPAEQQAPSPAPDFPPGPNEVGGKGAT